MFLQYHNDLPEGWTEFLFTVGGVLVLFFMKWIGKMLAHDQIRLCLDNNPDKPELAVAAVRGIVGHAPPPRPLYTEDDQKVVDLTADNLATLNHGGAIKIDNVLVGSPRK